jgi:hypothetical protein
MSEPLKIGIDVWRNEWVNFNKELIFPHVKEEIQSMVESFYKYLEDNSKNNKSGVKCSNSTKI